MFQHLRRMCSSFGPGAAGSPNSSCEEDGTPPIAQPLKGLPCLDSSGLARQFALVMGIVHERGAVPAVELDF